MSTHTNLVFGFPVRAQYPFTTVVDGSIHHGMVEDWRDLIAAANGLTIVPEPTQEQLYGSGDLDEESAVDASYTPTAEGALLEQAREQYGLQVQGLIEQTGCTLYAAGSQDFEPDFFVAAVCPHPEAEPKNSPFRPLPDLAVGAEVLERLRRFCEVLGVPYEEPRWYLVNSYDMD